MIHSATLKLVCKAGIVHKATVKQYYTWRDKGQKRIK